MGKIQLLDCTLRDGGYVNDWRFGNANIVSIFERLADSGVDIIEIGFLDERRPFDIDRSIMPDGAGVDRIYGGLDVSGVLNPLRKLDSKGAMVVGMIDYGTCGIENIKPCSESFMDGIRVIFKKHLMHEAMAFCGELKKLGYKVFSQLVSVTSYSDDEMRELIKLVNGVKPYAVSMVDTYGLMHQDDMLHYYKILDEEVDLSVGIGLHTHNNFQMAYANDVAFLEYEGHHDIVVDGTLYGMGKNAGNAPLELLAMRLNEKYGKSYNIDPMLEAIEESIMSFYAKAPWGYKEFFYLCGKNKCHPNYLTYFENKKHLSVSRIDRMMADIEPEDKKLLYDKNVAESLYKSYCEGLYSDEKDRLKFVRETAGRKLLIIGPGKNIELQRDKVKRFIEAEHPYVISINYVPSGFDTDCIFVTNAKRYHDMTLVLKEERCRNIKILATTNVECRNGEFDFVVGRAPLLETNESIIDNSFLMLMKFMKSIDEDAVWCAGFDGYSDKEDNYCNPAMEYFFVKQEAANLNRHMKTAIAELRESMEINFITYSAYDAVEDIGSGGV